MLLFNFKSTSIPFKTAALSLSILLSLSNAAHASSIKVAFIGDQGVRSKAQNVLDLVASEGTDILLIQGDLGYDDNSASIWESQLNDALGADFPVLIAVGNHENFEWPKYQQMIQQRIDRINGLSCSGNTGIKAKCTYKNIDVVQVAPGIHEVAGVSPDDNYAQFVSSSFSRNDSQWRICSWHKPHKMMQTGTKTGSRSWELYDACLDAGAMVALAHNHSYSRTHLLSDYSTQAVVHKNNEMTLQPGQSFAFVSGLGGRNIKNQARGGDYFASIYTADQGAAPGALFCTFESTTADCYFKAINGAVPDQFSLTLGRPDTPEFSPAPPVASPTPENLDSARNSQGYVLSRTDKRELRWIDKDTNGVWGSIWIDEACAASLGGVSATGSWSELVRLAPGFDAIASPCTSTAVPTQDPVTESAPSARTGFAFARTDKNEFRWIQENPAGILGSIWIDQSCVDRSGGIQTSGDWSDLMELAPGFDTIASPCY